MFLEQIKNAILTSKQLEIKAESFSKLNKYFGKEIDDFSFKVEDSFELNLEFGEKEYSLNCVSSDLDFSENLYWFVVNEALKEVDFKNNSIEYLFNLGLRNSYDLTFSFLIELKHSYDVEGFEVKKLHSSRIFTLRKFQKLTKLKFRNIEEEKTLGYVLEQNSSLQIISKLKEDRDYFVELEAKAKSELFDELHEFSPKEKEFVNSSRKLVSQWLDSNCKKELRNLISVNPYCYYFSLKEEWLMPVDYLSLNTDYWFEAATVSLASKA